MDCIVSTDLLGSERVGNEEMTIVILKEIRECDCNNLGISIVERKRAGQLR